MEKQADTFQRSGEWVCVSLVCKWPKKQSFIRSTLKGRDLLLQKIISKGNREPASAFGEPHSLRFTPHLCPCVMLFWVLQTGFGIHGVCVRAFVCVCVRQREGLSDLFIISVQYQAALPFQTSYINKRSKGFTFTPLNFDYISPIFSWCFLFELLHTHTHTLLGQLLKPRSDSFKSF